MSAKKKQSGRKNDRAKGQGSRAFKPLLLIALIAVALWALSPLRARLGQEAEYKRLSHQYASLKNENSRLKSDIRKLKESPAFIELMARKDLGLVKSDEEAFTVIESTPTLEKPRKINPRPKPGIWERLKTGLSGLLGF